MLLIDIIWLSMTTLSLLGKYEQIQASTLIFLNNNTLFSNVWLSFETYLIKKHYQNNSRFPFYGR